VARPKEYYRSRLDHTTVLRARPSSATTSSSASTSAEVPPPALAAAEAAAHTGLPVAARPVCWAVTHSDGALGSLYTIPEYRRKGLAHLVCARRLNEDRRSQSHARVAETQGRERSQDRNQKQNEEPEAGEGDAEEGIQGFCYVFASNSGSRRLMRSMGWEEGWRVKWIYQDPGKVGPSE
jgi:GNAT superfamily N-acetyltransferase